jgi:hypothetical protein
MSRLLPMVRLDAILTIKNAMRSPEDFHELCASQTSL